MVSLKNSKGHQGSFSDQDTSHPPMFDSTNRESSENLIAPQQVASFYAPESNIKSFPAVWVIFIQLLLFVAFEVMMFILGDVIKTEILGGIDPPFAFLVLLHVILWAMMFLVDRYLHHHHHMLRKFGYLNFFTSTKDIRRIPIVILSIGNAGLLLLVSFVGKNRDSVLMSLVRIFQIMVSVEILICLLAVAVYLARVVRFNRARAFPDVYHQDLVGGFEPSVYFAPEVGYRDGECLDDLLEKQAEMIRYLQQHNANLGQRIVEIMQLLPKDKQNFAPGNRAPRLVDRQTRKPQ